MIDRKVIRYLVYLFVSIVLIYFLWFLSNEETKTPSKKAENSHIKYEIDPNTGDTIADIIDNTIFIHSTHKKKKLPNTPGTREFDSQSVFIDSTRQLTFNQKSITMNELEKELDVQLKKNPKLMLEIFVHPKSESGFLLNIVKIARERNLETDIKTLK